MEKTVPNSSLQTEDDYSFVSRTQAFPSTLNGGERDDARIPLTDEFINTSQLPNGSIGENEHLVTSYHALCTAYDHMKRKLSEKEQINKSLSRRLKALGGNSTERVMMTSQAEISNHDSEVAKAWEAYSDKCKECEKLRDDLRDAEQKAVQSQIDARDSTYREDRFRAESLKEEFRKKLQQADLDIRDHKNKLELALENLQKEKEYTEFLRKTAEDRHHKMQAEIEGLEQSLKDENRKNQDLVKELEKQRQLTQELLEKRENFYKDKIHELEGRILQDREEKSYLDQKVIELEKWKHDYQLSSGIPISLTSIQQHQLEVMDEECDSNSAYSDIDPAELVTELFSLTEELTVLKKQASQQSLVLKKIFQDPKIQESLMSVNCNGFDVIDENTGFSSFPSAMIHSDISSVQPSIDTRQIIEKSPSSDHTTLTIDEVGNETARLSPLAISRQIHTVDSSNLVGVDRTSPQKIDICIPQNLSNAFNNIRFNQTIVNDDFLQDGLNNVDDNASSYFSATPDASTPNSGPITLKRHNEGSQSSDSNTTLSNPDTLTENIPTNAIPVLANKAEIPPPAAKDRSSQKYINYGNQPAAGCPMQTLWPSAGKNVGGCNLTTLWPPHSVGSSNQSSIDVIDPTDESSTVSNQRDKNTELTEYLQKTGAREFRVQPVNRLPLNSPDTFSNLSAIKHPSNIPANRARTREECPRPPPRSNLFRKQQLRHSAVEQEEEADDRAFVGKTETRICPVCHHVFNGNTSETYMQRHINSHFSSDDDDTI